MDLSSTHRFSVAPMLDWTDRHCRRFHRCLTRRALLYTEMVTTPAILRGDRDRLLGFDPTERPLALQLGGSDPGDLAACARIGADRGYDEINLNVGCPSDRVQSGRFGACLMAEPDLVARCVGAMMEAVDIPVSVKTRLAIDEMEEWSTITGFIRTVAATGCRRFIVHARKAWLNGLSPKENRTVPPLRRDLVHRLRDVFPDIDLTLNGGVATIEEAISELSRVDGVMVGRAAYENPAMLARVDSEIYGLSVPPTDLAAAVAEMVPYVERETARGVPFGSITRHMLGLYQGVPGARAWRRTLTEAACRDDATADVLIRAIPRSRNDVFDRETPFI